MSHRRERLKLARGVQRAILPATVALVLVASTSTAAAQEMEERRIEENRGPGVNVRPGAYFPSRGDTGFAVDASATYGVPLAPLVIAPGARFAAYVGGDGAVTGMPVVEVMVPVGAFVPYAKGGVGIGHATRPGDAAAALMAGGGLDVHVTRDVLVGVDATYETVSGTGFNTFAIGPRVGVRY